MDPEKSDQTVWERIFAYARKRAKGREQQWLVDRLNEVASGYRLPRINNWSRRGVPPKEHDNLSAALRKPIAWVATGEEPDNNEALTADRVADAYADMTAPDRERVLLRILGLEMLADDAVYLAERFSAVSDPTVRARLRSQFLKAIETALRESGGAPSGPDTTRPTPKHRPRQ